MLNFKDGLNRDSKRKGHMKHTQKRSSNKHNEQCKVIYLLFILIWKKRVKDHTWKIRVPLNVS